MSSLNKAMVIGRLGKDPEVRYTGNNTAVATISVATTEKYKDRNGEQVENTEWHRVVAWGRLAEICEQYLTKGSLAYFEGPIQTKEWEDKDGNKRYTTEIKALTMQMLGGGGGGQGSPSSSGSAASGGVDLDDSFDDMDDDLPF